MAHETSANRERIRRLALGAIALPAMVGLASAVAPRSTEAGWVYCSTYGCSGMAGCSGDSQSGSGCSYTCWVYDGDNPVSNGSFDCS
jgi:hypothetical protein